MFIFNPERLIVKSVWSQYLPRKCPFGKAYLLLGYSKVGALLLIRHHQANPDNQMAASGLCIKKSVKDVTNNSQQIQ